MKKRLVLLFIALVTVSTLNFNVDALTVVPGSKAEILNNLPDNAKLFIERHFSSYHFENCKKKKQNYRLAFSSLGHIEFSSFGEWLKVDGVAMQLPSSLYEELPREASVYMKTKYSNCGIKQLSRDDESYTIKLIYPDITVIFDTKGSVLSDMSSKDKNEEKNNHISME